MSERDKSGLFINGGVRLGLILGVWLSQNWRGQVKATIGEVQSGLLGQVRLSYSWRSLVSFQ
jgi:hypothetical protein